MHLIWFNKLNFQELHVCILFKATVFLEIKTILGLNFVRSLVDCVTFSKLVLLKQDLILSALIISLPHSGVKSILRYLGR